MSKKGRTDTSDGGSSSDWEVDGPLELEIDEEDGSLALIGAPPGPAGVAMVHLSPSMTLELDRAEILRLVRVSLRHPADIDLLASVFGNSFAQEIGAASGFEDGASTIRSLSEGWAPELLPVRRHISHLALLDELRDEKWPDMQPSPWWSAEVSYITSMILGHLDEGTDAGPLGAMLKDRARDEAECSIEAWTDALVEGAPRRALGRLITLGEAIKRMVPHQEQVITDVIVRARDKLEMEATFHREGATLSIGPFQPIQAPELIVGEQGSMRASALAPADPIEIFGVPVLEEELAAATGGHAFMHVDTRSGETLVEIGATLDAEVWVRVFDRTSGRVIDMARFEPTHDGLRMLAQLTLPANLDQRAIAVDVTLHPSRSPEWTPLGRVLAAFRWGRLASDHERVRAWELAAEVWRGCAQAWRVAGDDQRATGAERYRDDAISYFESSHDMTRYVPQPFLFDDLDEGSGLDSASRT